MGSREMELIAELVKRGEFVEDVYRACISEIKRDPIELWVLIIFLLHEEYSRRFKPEEVDAIDRMITEDVDETALLRWLSPWFEDRPPVAIIDLLRMLKLNYREVFGERLLEKVEEWMALALQSRKVKEWAQKMVEDARFRMPYGFNFFLNVALEVEDPFEKMGPKVLDAFGQMVSHAILSDAFREALVSGGFRDFHVQLMLLFIADRKLGVPKVVTDALQRVIGQMLDEEVLVRVLLNTEDQLVSFVRIVERLSYFKCFDEIDPPLREKLKNAILKILDNQEYREYLQYEATPEDMSGIWDLAIVSDYRGALPPDVVAKLDEVLGEVLPSELSREFLLSGDSSGEGDRDSGYSYVPHSALSRLNKYISYATDVPSEKSPDDPLLQLAVNVMFDVLRNEVLGLPLSAVDRYKNWVVFFLQYISAEDKHPIAGLVHERLKKVLLDTFDEDGFKTWLLSEVLYEEVWPEPIQGIWAMVVAFSKIFSPEKNQSDAVWSRVFDSVVDVLRDGRGVLQWLLTRNSRGMLNLWIVMFLLAPTDFWEVADGEIRGYVKDILKRALSADANIRWLADEPEGGTLSHAWRTLAFLLDNQEFVFDPEILEGIEFSLSKALPLSVPRFDSLRSLVKFTKHLGVEEPYSRYFSREFVELVHRILADIWTSDWVYEELLSPPTDEEEIEIPEVWLVVLGWLKEGSINQLPESLRRVVEDVLIKAMIETKNVLKKTGSDDFPHAWMIPLQMASSGTYEHLNGRLADVLVSLLIEAMSSDEVRDWMRRKMADHFVPNVFLIKKIIDVKGGIDRWSEPLKSVALREIKLAEEALS